MSTVNGQEYQHANLRVTIATVGGGAQFETVTFSDINYEDGAPKKPVRNSQGKIIGKTIGDQEANGSLTMLKSEYDRLEDAMAQAQPTLGIGQIACDVDCAFGDGPLTVRKDILRGVMFQKRPIKSSNNQEALTVQIDLFVEGVEANGRTFINYEARG